MNKNQLLENYLFDDGLRHDLVHFANDLGISIGIAYNEESNIIAITSIDSNTNKIIINGTKLMDSQERKFVVAYQLAEYLKFNKRKLYSTFRIEQINPEIYELAKKLYDRSNKYLDNQGLIQNKQLQKKKEHIKQL